MHFGTQKGLPGNEIRCLLASSDGSIWLGGPGTGVVRCHLENNHLSITTVTTKQGLAINNVYSLAEDHHGHIWDQQSLTDSIPQIVHLHLVMDVWYSEHTKASRSSTLLIKKMNQGLSIRQ